MEEYICPVKATNGKDIKSGDRIIFNGEHFMVLYNGGKDGIDWILHPCDCNTLDESLDLAALPSTMSDGLQFELIEE